MIPISAVSLKKKKKDQTAVFYFKFIFRKRKPNISYGLPSFIFRLLFSPFLHVADICNDRFIISATSIKGKNERLYSCSTSDSGSGRFFPVSTQQMGLPWIPGPHVRLVLGPTFLEPSTK